MDHDPFSYLARLEILAFFAGYAIVYGLVSFVGGELHRRFPVLSTAEKLLPYGYALAATMFLGFILKKVYIGYTIGVSVRDMYHPSLIIWGFAALLFWWPPISRRPLFSLLHSLSFFFFIAKDIYSYAEHIVEKDIIKNDMSILTNSILLNSSTFLIVVLLYSSRQFYKRRSEE